MLFHVRCRGFFCEWIHSTTHLLFSRNGPDGSQDGSLFFDLDHTKRFAALYRIAWIPWGSRRLSMVGGLFRRWMGFSESKSTGHKITETQRVQPTKTIKHPSVFGVCDWILQNQSTKTLNRWCWHMAPGIPRIGLPRWIDFLRRLIARCDLWHWCCVQLAPGMWTNDEEIQILWLFQCPEKLWVDSFWNWHRFQNTSAKPGRFISRSDTWDISGCSCRSSWRVLATILLMCCAMDSCFIVTWSLQHSKSLQWIAPHECWWCMVSTSLCEFPKYWHPLYPFVDCGAFLWGV